MSKQYDLEERTFQFAKNVSLYVKKFTRTISNMEYGKQVIRASGYVGANYIEANEALSKKDFVMRIKIKHYRACNINGRICSKYYSNYHYKRKTLQRFSTQDIKSNNRKNCRKTC